MKKPFAALNKQLAITKHQVKAIEFLSECLIRQATEDAMEDPRFDNRNIDRYKFVWCRSWDLSVPAATADRLRRPFQEGDFVEGQFIAPSRVLQDLGNGFVFIRSQFGYVQMVPRKDLRPLEPVTLKGGAK